MFQVLRSPLARIPALAFALAARAPDSTGPSLTQDQSHTDLMTISAKVKHLSALPTGADFRDAGQSLANTQRALASKKVREHGETPACSITWKNR
ncbi:MAG TPA: hypothetical protein VJ385_22335 [Fibrobacteria bacterium]|nr:hypothetical protein [Fibrobacteria bacterium]